MNKVLLLTGSSGFLGQAVKRAAALQPDLEVREVKRTAPDQASWPLREEHPRAQVALLHLGWPSLRNYSAQGGGGDDRAEWQAFCAMTRGLAERCQGEGVPFFQVGSGVERYAGEGGPLGEPYATYAWRKAEIWELIKAHGPETVARFRVHFVFGPGEADGRLIPAAIRAAWAGEPYPMGALERQRHWSQVDDVGAGLISAAFAQSPENSDICGPETVSFTDIALLIGEAVGKPLIPLPPEKPPADAACPVIEAENPASFLPPAMGGLTDLGRKLQEYAEQLLSSG